MRKQTAYFSLALIVAVALFIARFGVRPAAFGPASAGAHRGERSIGAGRVALAAVASASPVPLPTLTLPATSGARAASRPSAVPITTPAATPGILSRSGSANLPEPTASVDRLNAGLLDSLPSKPAAKLQAADPLPTAPAGAEPEVRSAESGPDATRDSSGPRAPERIVVPAIKLDSKVVPVGWKEVQQADGSTELEWEVASYAVGWHKTSARLGEPGNTVLTGHNNELGEVFRHLEHLSVGDPIMLYAGGRAYQYKVSDKFILREAGEPLAKRLENARWIGTFPDERITLMSCWPYTGNSHRIFVIAKPVGRG